jgi:hypothetical protein
MNNKLEDHANAMGCFPHPRLDEFSPAAQAGFGQPTSNIN